MRLFMSFVVGTSLFVAAATTSAQLGNTSFYRLDDPAIGYTTRSTDNSVSQLNKKIQNGDFELRFDGRRGYLRALLDALNIPVESQMLVFSKTSAQLGLISPQNPRMIFFNDDTAVAWMPGGFIEIAAQDRQQGTIFYTLGQQETERPLLLRQDWCLGCHYNSSTIGVPGLVARSTATQADGITMPWLADFAVDDTTPLAKRWGGWYVTGNTAGFSHMGNVFAEPRKPLTTDDPMALASLDGKLSSSAYIDAYSDVAALLVFNHQIRMSNLFTRIGWEARIGVADGREDLKDALTEAAKEVVDYMLFMGEPPLPSKVQGTSGFAESFAKRGPVDSKGRSLRQLELDGRLMRYPCSYMIYATAFDALPPEARDAIYQRLWQVLSGQDKDAKYGRMSHNDRQSIVEILHDTKKDLPSYFQATAVE